MTNTDDDERAAREWLNRVMQAYSWGEEDARNRTIISRLLDRPTCPRGEDVPDNVVDEMWKAYAKKDRIEDRMRAAINVLHDWRNAPPPVKRIELYAVVSPTGDVISVYDKEDGVEPRVRNGGRIVKLVESVDE